MAQLPEILEWYSATPMINEFRSEQAFLKNFLFSDEEFKPTENFTVSVMSGGGKVAPFVRRGRQAIMSGGYDESEQTISPPNIRIKRVIPSSDVIFRRHAGDKSAKKPVSPPRDIH